MSSTLIGLLFCINFYIKSTNSLDNSYDFVIVGGGTAGCVLANRLSEKYTVIVIEDGEVPPGDLFDIPATVIFQYGDTSPHLKVYKSVPQKNAGMDWDGEIEYFIGKMLGGGSSLNGMLFNRGSPHDYDNWANLTYDQSWNYDNLMKYFKRIEDYHGNFSSNGQHGKGGHITISTAKYAPGLEALMEAGEFFGYPSWKDPNGPQMPSFTPLEYSRKDGFRVSAYKGYLKPIMEARNNLTVLTHSEVKRIIFDEHKKRSIGVAYEQQNDHGEMVTKKVLANKEVIISAGAMDSPALLMKSGIGPKDVLGQCNIPVVKVLPVGYNMHDHVYLSLSFEIDRNTSAGVFIPKIDLNNATWKEFLETGDGPYSSFNGDHGQAFFVSSFRKIEIQPNPIWADVQLLHFQAANSFQEEDTRVAIYTLPFLVRPKSRGRITLNCSDVDAMPLIDFQYLSDPDGHDMAILLEAVKLTIQIYETAPSFIKQNCEILNTFEDSCANFTFKTDDYWKCYIRHTTVSGWHAGGGNRMGYGEYDHKAVVDTRLKVIGINGLRVVDMSIVPQVTNANTQACAYVIAEKAAQMILEDWSSKSE